ncbi:unnamed protein product [Fraxinus pennsylvanica]|uniref:Xylanase inhibitor N-terminal domain-containing protein n=1 Tax=Fraxinus pennsylvanica TaxID=56036 RepID=A0AAD1ZYS2_9LAMI|nr:unnamed protein product [Fraxinus pennsylvanica]
MCGYHQEFSAPHPPPFADGVLGLGSFTTSILSQLSDRGLIKKVMALCLSDEHGPGYLVLGDSQSNLPETTWPRNMLGPADILYNENRLPSVKGLATKAGTPVEDPYLPVCWRPEASTNDFVDSFSSFCLSSTSANDVYFELARLDYLTTSPRGNVCLGILESMPLQRRLVIYDHENRNLVEVDCSNLPEQLSKSKQSGVILRDQGKGKGDIAQGKRYCSLTQEEREEAAGLQVT